MEIWGQVVRLRPAVIEDRKKIFQWLTQSDVTSSMMGPPDYPDHPLPTWEEFKQDYGESFFSDDEGVNGKNYIILAQKVQAGTIGYDNLDILAENVNLDIWMRAEKFCRHGYGSDAMNTLITHLYNTYGIKTFRVDPSQRNLRAIAFYRKSGFVEEKYINRNEGGDYDDTVVMVRNVSN